jgi:hypothetical protein
MQGSCDDLKDAMADGKKNDHKHYVLNHSNAACTSAWRSGICVVRNGIKLIGLGRWFIFMAAFDQTAKEARKPD